ncbi:MAG: YciI family protein [Aestuariivirgaceae bacterium]
MKFAVLFEDNPGSGAGMRARHMPDHLAFLERHAAKIDAAGPLTDADASGAGGLWIVTADDEAEVRQLVEQDPFWLTGLRKSVRILSWMQVFADGERLIDV